MYVDPKSMVFLERNDTRLEGLAPSVGLRVREPARQEKLRLRNVVHGVMSRSSLFAGLLQLLRICRGSCRVDTSDLQKRFYSLSRQFHPDRFARGAAAEQQYALDATALLNDAYRVLRDPIQRAEYLLKQEGFDIGEQRSKDVPPELLEEVFELNMLLEETPERDELERARAKFQSHAGRNRRGTLVPVRTLRRIRRPRGSSRHSRRL